MEETLTRIREAAKRQGVPCGIHLHSIADVERRVSEGWQFIALGSELKMMLDGAGNFIRQLHPERGTAEMAKY